MGQKILVALDESENAGRSVEFVVKSMVPEHEVTLFSVLPDTATICDMQSPELTPYFLKEQIAFCTIEDKKKELVRDALEKARDRLVKAGFDERKVTVKVQGQKKGIARDIIREASSGYDMVVMGRRGLSAAQEFFLGSVSQKVLHGVEGGCSILLVS